MKPRGAHVLRNGETLDQFLSIFPFGTSFAWGETKKGNTWVMVLGPTNTVMAPPDPPEPIRYLVVAESLTVARNFAKSLEVPGVKATAVDNAEQMRGLQGKTLFLPGWSNHRDGQACTDIILMARICNR